MRSIWVRAGLGALAVFALGMLLYTAAGRTKARARQALMELKAELDSGAVLAGDHLDRAIPFVLNGRTLGELTNLTLVPGEGGAAPGAARTGIARPRPSRPGHAFRPATWYR